MRRLGEWTYGRRLAAGILAGLLAVLPAQAEFDQSRYMSPDDLRPGMKGFGRTVMSGTRIETFNFEVIGVMRNAYYAKQDVILIRCSGLNLEHSGIIGGMSGSPCYIKDESGRERMIGAVAYGWAFNKDPICGVQPITQMLPISEVRMPRSPSLEGDEPEVQAGGMGGGLPVGEIIARVWNEPIDEASPFSIFNEDILRIHGGHAASGQEPGVGMVQAQQERLRPLLTPVMISGLSDRTMGRLQQYFDRYGLMPVAAGGPSAAAAAEVGEVKLEPGSALCIPFVRGDIVMNGLGTCTEVMGDRVLGFGHSMFGEGSVELPLATGMVHTIIPSIMRSNKIGASLQTVGTLVGDESSGIFGLQGPAPRMVPLEVVVQDVRGAQTYNYEIMQEPIFTAILLGVAVVESIYAHNDPPKEHTVRYSIETEFEDVGTYRTSNFTSQNGVFGIMADIGTPAMAIMNAPFARGRVNKARVEVTIDSAANAGQIDQVTLPRTIYKPGETVTASVRWMHYRRTPLYSQSSYSITLPDDLPDGEYQLSLSGAQPHLSAMQARKPHLFRADSLGKMLEAFNLIGSCPQNRLYMTLELPTGGLAVDRLEMPNLPSFQRQILTSLRRSDIHRYSDALTVKHETDFAVSGSQAIKISVNRRADQ